MSRRIRKSEAQANAEALARRGMPYATTNAESLRFAWDYRQRQPRDLREAVRAVRRAYQDEVPVRLHEGPDDIGEDGTPKWAPRAEGYVFGPSTADDGGRDAETGERDPVAWYRTPFRATMDRMGHAQDEARRHHAAIVAHVTIGGQEARDAAITEGVPTWCAGLVAETAIRSFLANLSDLKVTVPKEEAA